MAGAFLGEQPVHQRGSPSDMALCRLANGERLDPGLRAFLGYRVHTKVIGL